jgi:sulfatase maturation enzyme AslB (radical SAM superfamily)
MCHQQHRQRAVLACDSLIANVDLSPFETVEIQGGEPLFIPEAAKYLDYVIALQKRVVILTNGTLIDEAWAEKLARQATVVRISLNAATKHTHELINRGSRWERVMRGIELLRIERDRQQTSLRIRGHMTVVRENLDEIPLFIRQFPAFGFDGINFGFDRSVPLFLRDNPSQKLRLASEIEEALGTCGSHRVSTDRLKLLALVAPSI